MKLPKLKNHTLYQQVKTIGQLWRVLHQEKSIFIRSWNRVHPCKFFLNNDKAFTIKILEEMIDAGEFITVIRKKGAGYSSLVKYVKSNPGLMNFCAASMNITHKMPAFNEKMPTVDQAGNAINDFLNSLSKDETAVFETERVIEWTETGCPIITKSFQL